MGERGGSVVRYWAMKEHIRPRSAWLEDGTLGHTLKLPFRSNGRLEADSAISRVVEVYSAAQVVSKSSK